MQKRLLFAAAPLLALALVACNNDNNNDGGSSGGTTSGTSGGTTGGTSGGDTTPISITDFVKQLLAQTSDETSQPVSLDVRVLLPSDESPTTFDSYFVSGS